MTARDPAPRWLRWGLALSLLAHVAVALLARWSLAPTTRTLSGEPTAVDIEVAPPAPEVEKLPEEVAAPPPPAAKPRPRPPKPKPEPVPEETEVAVLDAGVADDAEAVAMADAGVEDDAGAVAMGDAGDGDGGQVASGTDGDAGLVAMGDGGVPGDGGTDGEGAVAGLGGGAASAGTAADLLSYFPDGHVVSVLLRLDRLRGTEWAPAAEKVMAPMPDYRSLVGERDVHVADLFESIVISSFDARRVDATTLVARTTMPPAGLRSFLDQPDAPVAWSVAQGGMLGKRGASARVFPGDPRVFLSPFPGWLVLAQPADLGEMTSPGPGDLDHAQASPEIVPGWLDRVRTIEAEAGAGEGPAVVVTVGTVGRRFRVPDVGLGVTSIPAPERITLALTVAKRGFEVRGNLRFTTEEGATEFVTTAESVKAKVLDSQVFQAMLRRGKLLNALKGLSLSRTGRRVAYATSISISDSRALMTYAAKAVHDWYGQAGRPPAP